MICIGICDDEADAQNELYLLCERFSEEKCVAFCYFFFSSGEEVVNYCKDRRNETMDILFLDIEMPGLSGIELLEFLKNNEKIRRIAFATNYLDNILDAFSTKTIGFIPKPPEKERVFKVLQMIKKELEENSTITIRSYQGNVIEIRLDDILYMKASGSYTEIYMSSQSFHSEKCILCAKKIGDLEKEIGNFPIIRVHRSYMVNLSHISELGDKIILDQAGPTVPIGRNHRAETRNKYFQFVKERIKMRL